MPACFGAGCHGHVRWGVHPGRGGGSQVPIKPGN